MTKRLRVAYERISLSECKVPFFKEAPSIQNQYWQLQEHKLIYYISGSMNKLPTTKSRGELNFSGMYAVDSLTESGMLLGKPPLS
jgi:hypothetical protein